MNITAWWELGSLRSQACKGYGFYKSQVKTFEEASTISSIFEALIAEIDKEREIHVSLEDRRRLTENIIYKYGRNYVVPYEYGISNIAEYLFKNQFSPAVSLTAELVDSLGYEFAPWHPVGY